MQLKTLINGFLLFLLLFHQVFHQAAWPSDRFNLEEYRNTKTESEKKPGGKYKKKKNRPLDFTIGAVTVNLADETLQGDQRITTATDGRFCFSVSDFQRFVSFYFSYIRLTPHEVNTLSKKRQKLRRAQLIRNALSLITYIAERNRLSATSHNRSQRIRAATSFYNSVFDANRGTSNYRGYFGRNVETVLNGLSKADNGVVLFILTFVAPWVALNSEWVNVSTDPMRGLHARFDILQRSFTRKSYERNFFGPDSCSLPPDIALNHFDFNEPGRIANLLDKHNLASELVLLAFMRALSVGTLTYELFQSQENRDALASGQQVLRVYLTSDLLSVSVRAIFMCALNKLGLPVDHESQFDPEECELISLNSPQSMGAFFHSISSIMERTVQWSYNGIANVLNHILHTGDGNGPFIPVQNSADLPGGLPECGHYTDRGNDYGETANSRINRAETQANRESEPMKLDEATGYAQPASVPETTQQGVCVICLENPPDQIHLPCRHLCACEECGKKINERGGRCPICRSKGHFDRVFR